MRMCHLIIPNLILKASKIGVVVDAGLGFNNPAPLDVTSQLQKSERTVSRAREVRTSLVAAGSIPVGLFLAATDGRRASSAATRRAATPYGGMRLFQSGYDARSAAADTPL